MKKIVSLAFLLTFVLLALVCTAFADTGSPASAGGISLFFDNTVQPLLVSLVGALVSVLFALGCRYLTKLTGINISQASQQQLEGIAEKSVLAVEEKAAASLKTAGESWTGYQKHKEAIDNMLALAPSLSHDQADLLVHWAIAKIPGVGATGVLGGTNDNAADTAGGTAAVAG